MERAPRRRRSCAVPRRSGETFPACNSAAKFVGAAAQRCELGERGRRTEGSSAAMGRRERRRGVGASGEELAKELSAAAAANPASGWRRVGKMNGNCVCLGFFFLMENQQLSSASGGGRAAELAIEHASTHAGLRARGTGRGGGREPDGRRIGPFGRLTRRR